MATLTIEITDASKEFVDREIASGRFKDPSALMQMALDQLMRTQWKEDAEKKIEEALDEYERGDFTPYRKGDCGRMARQYLKEKRAREEKERIDQLLLESLASFERGEATPMQSDEFETLAKRMVERA